MQSGSLYKASLRGDSTQPIPLLFTVSKRDVLYSAEIPNNTNPTRASEVPIGGGLAIEGSAETIPTGDKSPADLGTAGSNPAPSLTNAPTSTTKTGMIVSANIAPSITSQHLAAMPDLAMGDPYPRRDLRKVAMRDHPAVVITVSSSAPIGSVLAQFNVPGIFAQFPNILDKLRNFAFYRAGVQLRFRFAGSLSMAGRARIVYLKNPPTTYSMNDFNQYNWLDPHTLDYGSGEDLIITIPWFSQLLGAPLGWDAARKEIAAVAVAVEHPLVYNGSTGTTMANIEVYASLIDLEYWGDIPGNPSASLATEVSPAILANLIQDYKMKAKLQSGIASDLITKLNGGNSKGDNPDMLSSLVGDITETAVKAATSMLWCKPMYNGASEPLMTNQFSHLANATGIAPVANVGYHQDTNVRTMAQFADTKDLDTLNSIASIPGIIYINSYDTTATRGQLLFRVPVTPAYHTGYPSNTESGSWCPPPCAHVANHFDSWRGSMNYRLTATATQMAHSKIFVCYYPNSAALPSTSTQAIANQGELVGFVMDVCGTSSKCFNIPYLNNLQSVLLGSPIQAKTDAYNTGFLEFRVLIPPSAQNAQSGRTSFTLEAAAGNDSFWFKPRRSTFSPSPNKAVNFTQVPLVAPSEKAVLQSVQVAFKGGQANFPALDESTSRFNAGVTSTDAPQNLKEFACKPTCFNFFTGDDYLPIMPACKYISLNGTPINEYTMWQSLASIFRAFKGTTQVYWDKEGGKANWVYTGKGFDQPVASFQADMLGALNTSGIVPTTLPVDVGFSIPYYSPLQLFYFNDMANIKFNQPSYDYPCAIVVKKVPDPPPLMFIAWGDDVTFGALCPPQQSTYPSS